MHTSEIEFPPEVIYVIYSNIQQKFLLEWGRESQKDKIHNVHFTFTMKTSLFPQWHMELVRYKMLSPIQSHANRNNSFGTTKRHWILSVLDKQIYVCNRYSSVRRRIHMQQICKKCLFSPYGFHQKWKSCLSDEPQNMWSCNQERGYMQSPYENLNTAKFYYPKSKHSVSFSMPGVNCAVFLWNYNAERASFNLESSAIIAQNTVIYQSASHKCSLL